MPKLKLTAWKIKVYKQSTLNLCRLQNVYSSTELTTKKKLENNKEDYFGNIYEHELTVATKIDYKK